MLAAPGRKSIGPGTSQAPSTNQSLKQHAMELLTEPTLALEYHGDGIHIDQSPEGQPSSTHSEHNTTEEDTSEDMDMHKTVALPTGGRNAIVKRRTAALMERMAAKESQQLPSLAQGVEQLLNLDIQHLKKRGRGEGSDSAAEQEVAGRRQRRPRNSDFNAAALIGSIFMRVQGPKAPGPLVYFEEGIDEPQWFKESIDGVQPVMGSNDFDPEQVMLESMGKLVDGNVLPATLGEVSTYFTHVLGDPRINKEITPRVLIAIQCDRAKGWFTYRRDNDNSTFVPVVLCASETGRGLEEVSPAHFEVHRAQCAQKKWRQSFKVLGAQKLHKVTSLAQAALGDVLRHFERVLGAERPTLVADIKGTPTLPRLVNASSHPTFRHSMSSEPSATDDAITRAAITPHERDLMPPRPYGNAGAHSAPVERLPSTSVDAPVPEPVRRHPSTSATAQMMRTPPENAPRPPAPRVIVHHVPGANGNRAGALPGSRPAHTTLPPTTQPRLSRVIVTGRPIVPNVASEDALPPVSVPAAHPSVDPRQALDLLANAASTAINSPTGGPTGVQAGLLASALSGVSFNELLQLVIDNTQRRQQHQQQTALLQQLAALQAQTFQADTADVAADVERAKATAAAARPAGSAASGPSAAAAAKPAASTSSVLTTAESEAITEIMKSVRGVDVSHAVRGILQHVAMSYGAEQATNTGVEAVFQAAVQAAKGAAEGSGEGPAEGPAEGSGEGLPEQVVPEGLVNATETMGMDVDAAVQATAPDEKDEKVDVK